MYRWVPVPELPADQRDELGLDRGFPDQQSAERWLTATYPDLLEGGVTAVSLLEEDRHVYGPMSLEA